MSEVAGRLEIPVESDTSGFAQALKRKVEAITKEVVATIRAEVDTASMKETLEAKVKEAQNGVTARVGIDLEKDAEAKLRGKLEAVVKAASAGIKAKVGVEVDKKTAQEMRKAIDGTRGPGIEVPAKVNRKGLFASWVAARNSIDRDAKRKPIDIPFMPASFRSAFMPVLYMGIASLIQPLIAVIGGAVGGLAAMAGSLSAIVNVAAAGPAALGGMMLATKALGMSFGFLGDKIEDVPKKLRPVWREFDKVRKSWKDMSTGVALTFWEDMQDQMEPISDALLPHVEKGLKSVAKQFSNLGLQVGKFVKTSRFDRQMDGLMADSAKLAGSVGRAMFGWAKGMLNVADAAGPMVERISKFIERTGKWAAGIGNTKAESDKLAETFEYAGDKAAQLWRIAKDVGAAIKATFLAGRDSGDSLLGSLEKNVRLWRDWSTSATGQNRIKEWFKTIEPIARSVGDLIVDLGRSLGRLSEDSNVADMVESLRKDLLPNLERFLNNMGKAVGPSVIALVSNLLEVLTEFSEAGSPVGRMLGVIADGFGLLGDFLQKYPRIAQLLGTILGGLLAYRALAFIGKMTGVLGFFDGLQRRLGGGGLAVNVVGFSLALGGLTGSLSGLPGPADGAAAALGTFMMLQPMIGPMTTALTRMFDGIRNAQATGGGGFRGLTAAIGTRAGLGIRGAISGLGAALGIGGGLPGVAIAGGLALVSAGVGKWAESHAAAKQKAQDFKQYVDDIVASLQAESGALTQATSDRIADQLERDGVLKNAKQYGVELDVLTQAAMGNKSAQAKLNDQLADSALKMQLARENGKYLGEALKLAGINQQSFADALLTGGSAIDPYVDKMVQAASGNQYLSDMLNLIIPGLYTAADGQRVLADKTGSSAKAVKIATERFELLAEANGTARRQIEGVIEKIGKVKGKKITVDAMTEQAKTTLEKLGYKVKTMPDGKVVITATAKTANAERELARAARDRESSINVTYRTRNKPPSTYSGNYGGGQADGSILHFSRFAEGGFHSLADMARNKFRSFANGVENHVAQIARPGEWRVWAEDETGGEAYIPLAMSKRVRSMQILREVADRFGMALGPKVDALALSMRGTGRTAPVASSYTRGNAPVAPVAEAAGADRSAARFLMQFHKDAINVHNPVAETASKSLADVLRNTSEFGLLDGGEE